MAPKKITGYVKLQIMAGKATPAPPVGPALGQAQVNIMEFCKQFNARTKLRSWPASPSPSSSASTPTAPSASSPRRLRLRCCC